MPIYNPPPNSGSSTNATSLQGVAISTTAPTDSQVLEYSLADNKWEPTSATNISVNGASIGLNVTTLITVNGV